MEPSTIEMKLQIYTKRPFYIKADTSSENYTTVPEEVVNIDSQFAEIVGTDSKPLRFCADNPMGLRL